MQISMLHSPAGNVLVLSGVPAHNKLNAARQAKQMLGGMTFVKTLVVPPGVQVRQFMPEQMMQEGLKPTYDAPVILISGAGNNSVVGRIVDTFRGYAMCYQFKKLPQTLAELSDADLAAISVARLSKEEHDAYLASIAPKPAEATEPPAQEGVA